MTLSPSLWLLWNSLSLLNIGKCLYVKVLEGKEWQILSIFPSMYANMQDHAVIIM